MSVRTLHHYDAIGLLVPQHRTAAGYRVYSEADLLRLQQILIGRALGLSLEEIRRSLDDPAFDQALTPDDWKALTAEQASIHDDAYAALKAGQSPADEAVMDIAERHRLSIDRWFYSCSHRLPCGLAAIYEGDDRFKQRLDAHGEGLTSFLAEAIRANASREQG